MPNPPNETDGSFTFLWSNCATGIEFQPLVCFTQITEQQEGHLKTDDSIFQDKSLELTEFLC